MRPIADVDVSLREALPRDFWSTAMGTGSGFSFDYMKSQYVALAMNQIFGPLGWDVKLDDVSLLREPYRIDKDGNEDPKGKWWNAWAMAKVTIITTVIGEDGKKIETRRQEVGAGEAYAGKQNSPFRALKGALTSAATHAMKRAAKWFAPKTGLILKFDNSEREWAQREVEAMRMTYLLEAEERGELPPQRGFTEDHEPDSAPDEPQAPAEHRSEPGGADAGQASGDVIDYMIGDKLADTLLTVTGGDAVLVGRLLSLGANAEIARADLAALHQGMSVMFGADSAREIWVASDITPGRTAVTRGHLDVLCQVIDEMRARVGTVDSVQESMERELDRREAEAGGQGRPAASPPEPAERQEPQPTAQAELVESQAPAPEEDAPPPAVEPAAPRPQAICQDPDRRRDAYRKTLGAEIPDELIESLATAPDDGIMSNLDASALHSLAMSRILRDGGEGSVAWDMWARAGVAEVGREVTWGQGRLFAALIPK